MCMCAMPRAKIGHQKVPILKKTSGFCPSGSFYSTYAWERERGHCVHRPCIFSSIFPRFFISGDYLKNKCALPGRVSQWKASPRPARPPASAWPPADSWWWGGCSGRATATPARSATALRHPPPGPAEAAHLGGLGDWDALLLPVHPQGGVGGGGGGGAAEAAGDGKWFA